MKAASIGKCNVEEFILDWFLRFLTAFYENTWSIDSLIKKKRVNFQVFLERAHPAVERFRDFFVHGIKSSRSFKDAHKEEIMLLLFKELK